MKEFTLKGIPAAPGIAWGAAFILDKQEFVVAPRAIMEKEVPIEIARFEEALSSFEGTVLAVLHDRYFIDRFASEIWWVEDRGIRRELRD